MTNIDSDDAIGDLLSEGSNDSFFEEPKVLAKRASLTKTPDKKSIADLFGLDNDKPKENLQSKSDDWLGIGNTGEERPKTTQSSTTQKTTAKKISFENDDEDILSTIGLEKKPEASTTMDPVSKKLESSKKSALMESLFGPPKQQSEEPSTLEDILKESKLIKQKSEEVIPTKNEPVKAVPHQDQVLPQKNQAASQKPENYSLSDLPREGRRSRRPSLTTSIKDPLGLFSDETTTTKDFPEPLLSRPRSERQSPKPVRGEGDAGAVATETLRSKDMKTKSVPNIKDLPDWLGGGNERVAIKTYKSETAIKKTDKEKPLQNEEEIPIEEQPIIVNESPMLETLLAQQKLATSHMEYQNTSIALQQQESQLLMALQLKKYEENLSEMQRKQQEILIKQEQQFNSLLERQFAKQQVMENNMRLQQERINNHIQMLLSQPPVAGKMDLSEQIEDAEQLKNTRYEENSRLYEEMISTLRERQHEEIFLLNESYKKQISLLENSMESVENRLKDEFTSLSGQFNATITQMKKEHEDEIDKYKQKLEDMSAIHGNEIKMIRENHNRILEEIRYEYSTMIENLKQMKQTENSILQNADSYAQKLDNSVEILDDNAKTLNEIRSKMERDYGALSIAREESLKAKDEEIKLTRYALEKARESTETERAQLIALVRSLEMKLVEQTQNSKEESWALQQETAILVARSAAFDREVEFTRATLERERDQLKTLKETTLAEQERAMLQLTEEKLALSAEKARLETTAKLTQNYDSQKARAEIDAAIKVAKEAAELTDKEREDLHRKQSEVEILKRNLLDKEKKLSLKERNLEELAREAERKALDGEAAVAEAKALETKFNARLRDIQGQLVSLTNREKKLAEDKITLSKERLALDSKLREIRKCRLCISKDTNHGDDHLQADFVEQDFSPRAFSVTDPDILKLRYEINEERFQTDDSLK